MTPDEMNRIAPLGELDEFQVAEGDPDVRGWDVTTDGGEKVGEVDELLVDTSAMKVRYLAVHLDREVARGENRRVLVPIGAARLDDAEDCVRVTGIAATQFTTLPAYDRDAFNRDYESSVLPHFGGGLGAGAETGGAAGVAGRYDESDYYGRREFDDSNFIGERRRGDLGDDSHRIQRVEEELSFDKRQRKAGELQLRKRVETEHVSEPVTRRREEVSVERRPVSDARASGNVEIGEDEIRIPVVEEEVVVEKRPVVKEEIVVKKHAVNDERTVEADLRRERVDVDESNARRDRDIRRGEEPPRDRA